MKHSKTLTPILAILMIVATVAPAYATDLGVMTNTSVKIEDDRMYKGSDDDQDDDKRGPEGVRTIYNEKGDDKGGNRRDDDNKRDDDKNKSAESRKEDSRFHNRIKSWVIDNGTTGEVTAISGTTLSIKTAKNEIYTVTTTDANIRRGNETVALSSIVVGDRVFVMGIKNGSSIVASFVLTAKTEKEVKPTTEDKRQAYFGAVTAKTDTTLTILSPNNVSYTVTLATNAEIWINKVKQTNLSGFVVGDNVMLQGTLSGTTISAKKIVALHLPAGTIVGKVTASTNGSLTILGSNNTSYTVLTTDADIKAKGKDGTVAVGDSVVAKGDLAGTTLNADTVVEGKVNGGFFYRFGNFFKGIFGKK